MNSKRVTGNVLGITTFAVLCYLMMIYLETNLIYNKVIPSAGVIVNQWVLEFRNLAFFGITISWLAALVWYGTAQWLLKVNHINKAGKRGWWVLFFLIPLLSIVVIIIFFQPRAQEGEWWAYLLYLFNVIFTFYIPTVLFSPSSFKYTPPLAKIFRWW